MNLELPMLCMLKYRNFASKPLAIAWVLIFGISGDLKGVDFKAGAAKVDITPAAGLPMWGYSARSSNATGTLDPLYARVLVLESGEMRLALVALDLGRTFGPVSLARLREGARNSGGISYVLAVASHTHSGPVVKDEYPSGEPPAWENAALGKIIGAINDAHQRVVPCRLGTGYGVAYIAHNRRRLDPDGTVTMVARNETRIPTSPVDATVSVLRVDASDGRPLAVLVNYACHPVVFGPDNLQYSADFPAATCKNVEAGFGGQPLCIFLQGAPGDINPYYATTALEQDAVQRRDWEGEQLGQEVARVAKGIHTEEAVHPSLQFAEDLLTFHLRWNAEQWRQSMLSSYGQTFFDSFAPRIREEWQLPVATVLLNKRIAFMSMPGEPFVEFQINWRDRCPVPDAFFLGYANGYYGYFPTIRAATEGGYGATSSTTWIEVGAGEHMVNHALVRLYQMLDRLSDVPGDLKR
jgi:neutral ceramidase